MGRTIKEVQQDFAESSGFQSETIWDFLSANEGDILKEKLRQLIRNSDEGQMKQKVQQLLRDLKVKPDTCSQDLVQRLGQFISELEEGRSTFPQELIQKLQQVINDSQGGQNNAFQELQEKLFQIIRDLENGHNTFTQQLIQKLQQLKRDLEQEQNISTEELKQNLQHLIRDLEQEQKTFTQELRQKLEQFISESEDVQNILKTNVQQFICDLVEGQNTSIKELRNNLFIKIWSQRKYTNRNSLTALFYVLVTKETNFNTVENSKSFSMHPVWRTRKCVTGINNNNSTGCCMVFIDEVGRVYQNWGAYITENELPKGTMIAPKNGVYNFDRHGEVCLEKYATPAASALNTTLKVTDIAATGVGAFGVGVPLAAIALPVAAPLVAIAAGASILCGSYSTLRSVSNLRNRYTHEESIGLSDRQARSSWLGILGGTIGLGAAGATKVLTKVAAAGRSIPVVAEAAVNSMNVSSIALNGAGITNGLYDIYIRYRGHETPSRLEILQLSASLILFTHSVYNFRLASNIIRDSRDGRIQSYRKSLSNRQRRIFDKMAKETVRIRGSTQGKVDIIRGSNDISKQSLNDLYRINKNLNQRNIRPAFGASGDGIVLNNEVPVDTGVLRNNLQHNIGPDVLGQVTQPIPMSFNEAATFTNSGPAFFTSARIERAKSGPDTVPDTERLRKSTIYITNDAVISLANFGILFFKRVFDGESLEDILVAMGNIYQEDIFCFFMETARTFIETRLDAIEQLIHRFISTESVLSQLIQYCLRTYGIATIEFLRTMTNEILDALENYYLSLNPNNSQQELQKCAYCPGYFAQCVL